MRSGRLEKEKMNGWMIGGRRMGRRDSQPDGCLIAVACIIGIPAFLIMTHPFIFWLVFVPLVVIGAMKIITWLKK